jgi:cytochrome oxidase Cu insertion factor (SCO1/SenC/PrrC family)
MAQASQPHVLSAMVASFGAFDTAHGFAVNLFVVIVLAATGAGLLSGRRRLIRAALIAAAVLCLADWVLVQDFGFLGGLGTDPNSMIPTLLLLAGGYFALTPLPAADQRAAAETAAPAVDAEPAAAEPAAPATAPAASGNWRGWLRPERAQAALAAVGIQTVTALGAVAVVAIGAAPMAAASVNKTADPILAEAIAGYSPPLDMAASPFSLTDQHGRTVSLASLRGKVVLLTFLDPVCTNDCPLIAQEFKAAGALLGPQDSNVDLVAIAANPTYYGIQFTQAFDQQEGLSTVRNWLYLTGPLTQLEHIWNQYGIDVQDLPAGAMSAHNDLAFVIDRTGTIRQEISDDPGPATTSTQSSFGGLLAADARDALSQP